MAGDITKFKFHSDSLPFGIYKEITEIITTPAIPSMPTYSSQTFYGEWHELNKTGIYTYDIRWVTPDMQLTGGVGGETINEPNRPGYIRYGGFSRYSDMNASYQAGVVGVRFTPYVESSGDKFRIAIQVYNYYIPTNPLNVPSRDWKCTVSVYSIPASYGK